MSDPDNIPLYLLYAIIACSIVFNALLVLCNTAYSNVNVNKLMLKAEEGKDPAAKRAAEIVKKPLRCTYTNRVLSYLCIVIGTCAAIMLPFNDYLSAAVYLLVILTMGELFPRKIAIPRAEAVALRFSGFDSGLMVLMYPVVFVLTFITDIVLKLFRQQTKIEMNRFSEEEVMSLLEAGQQRGEIKEEGKKMINSIFEFDDELAYEIMTPRTDVFLIDINDPPEEYLDELMEMRYSRIPVCEDDSDNIIGILHIKDYLIKAREEGFDNVDIKSILRPPYFVPETKNIDSLFFELQRERQHIAILIDEYGGFSGICTMEDIIEEVMGEIDDEYDEEEEEVNKINDNTFIINGKADLDDLNEDLGLHLYSENSETIGGLIIDLLGEIPGEDATGRAIHYSNYLFTIQSVKERRIESVRLEILPETEEEENNEEQ
ncbi:MAG: HlyC/CorC family transporter [Eubacterium sp.]|nr:HlyC/CorC family transporter [Eubacterium sp.]